jgi:HAMP domain-containing protein
MKTQSSPNTGSSGFRWSLFWQILLATLLVGLVPLALVSYTSFAAITDTGATAERTAKEELDAKSIEALEVRAEETAAQISAFLDSRAQDTRYAALLPTSPEAYLSFYRSRNGYLWFLRGSPEAPAPTQARRLVPVYREMAFVDSSGQETIRIVDGALLDQDQLRLVSDPANTTFLTETYFERARTLPRGEIDVSPVMAWYVATEAQPAKAQDAEASQFQYINYEAVIRFSAPVYDDQDQFAGVVVLSLDHRHVMEFSNHIQSAFGRVVWPSYTSGNYAYLLDYEGWLIAHPDLTAVRGLEEDGSPMPTQTRATLEAGASLPFNMLQSDIKQQSVVIASAVLAGQKGHISAKTLLDTEKVDVYVPIPFAHGVYREGGVFGGLVISENVQNVERAGRISRDVIRQAAGRLRGNIAWIAGVSVVLLVTTAVLVSRSITYPIRRLTEAARIMEKGELDVETLDSLLRRRIENEVSELSRVFKQMAAAVQLRERQLKQEVRQLRIQIDRAKRAKEVKEIVETEFFEELQAKARALRQRRNRPTG